MDPFLGGSSSRAPTSCPSSGQFDGSFTANAASGDDEMMVSDDVMDTTSSSGELP